MRPPSITPNTLYALKATEYAKRQGAFLPFHKGLYGAYWEDGLDLSDPEVIRTVAEAAGLDWSDMAKNLDAGSYEESVMGEFQEAVELGVRGDPRLPDGPLPVHRRTPVRGVHGCHGQGDRGAGERERRITPTASLRLSRCYRAPRWPRPRGAGTPPSRPCC